MDSLLSDLLAARPRVVAELARPHSEEALLRDVVAAGGIPALGEALGHGNVERTVLWGHDLATLAPDPDVDAALAQVHPGAGRAVRLEAEPDLVVVTDRRVTCFDVSFGRPGHAAARAARGEPVPAARLQELAGALGGRLDERAVAASYAVARAAAVALALGCRLDRPPALLAVLDDSGDLLRPASARDRWVRGAGPVRAALDGELAVEALGWSTLARLLPEPAAAVLRRSPVVAAR